MNNNNDNNNSPTLGAPKTTKPAFVYLLVSNTGSTYVGATVDLDRRLRQHNGEIKGGAKITSKRDVWRRHCYVSGFPTWQSALQFEWRWKQITRKISKSRIELKSVSKIDFPLERRLCALTDLLALERSTSNAIPYADWSAYPDVIFSSSISA